MSFVIYEKKDRIAYITLNRPEKLNALGPEMVSELVDVWVDFRDDDNLWVAIITGKGKAFCAGADIRAMDEAGYSALVGREHSSCISTSPALLSTPAKYGVWKPIIAALNGYVLGAGLWLATVCDLRIAAADAEFGLPEPRAGVPTTVAAPLVRYFLPRGIAYELLLVGDKINAQRAYEAGIINKVVPSGELMTAATALAEKICENSPLAVRAMKEVMERGKDMDYEGGLTLTEHVFAVATNSEDRKEGFRAFKEKRKPEWKCR